MNYDRMTLPEYRRELWICDFCAVASPVYVYAANRMSTGEYRQVWRWAACEDCAACVQLEDWPRLKGRMAKALCRRYQAFATESKEIIDEAIDQSLGEFFKYGVKL